MLGYWIAISSRNKMQMNTIMDDYLDMLVDDADNEKLCIKLFVGCIQTLDDYERFIDDDRVGNHHAVTQFLENVVERNGEEDDLLRYLLRGSIDEVDVEAFLNKVHRVYEEEVKKAVEESDKDNREVRN